MGALSSLYIRGVSTTSPHPSKGKLSHRAGQCSESAQSRGCTRAVCGEPVPLRGSAELAEGEEPGPRRGHFTSADTPMSSVPCPHPLAGPPGWGGDPAVPPVPAAAWPRNPEEPRHVARGEICFASGVQAGARGGEGCRGVVRPPLTCEECCESPGKHPQAASPSASLRAAGTERCESGTSAFGVRSARHTPIHPDTPRYSAHPAAAVTPARGTDRSDPQLRRGQT